MAAGKGSLQNNKVFAASVKKCWYSMLFGSVFSTKTNLEHCDAGALKQVLSQIFFLLYFIFSLQWSIDNYMFSN